MKYELFNKLPDELLRKIFMYIDFQVPGAVAIKTAPIREIKNQELFSISPPTGEAIKLIDSEDELNAEWEEFQNEAELMDFDGALDNMYWMGFYAAHDI